MGTGGQWIRALATWVVEIQAVLSLVRIPVPPVVNTLLVLTISHRQLFHIVVKLTLRSIYIVIAMAAVRGPYITVP